MAAANVQMQVRKVDPKVSIIDISGEITSGAETGIDGCLW